MIDKKYITYKRGPFFQIAKDIIREGNRVLDVGSGDGSFPKFCNRNDFYLLEGNPETVNFLKPQFPNVVLGRIPEIPFEDKFFDVIHCSHIIEHLCPDELYEFLKEVDRVLAPNGNIVISTPLLSERFYDDLSHIKPYNPLIFDKYFCESEYKNLTREKISNNYFIQKIVYRYSSNYDRFNIVNLKPKNIINKFLIKLIFYLRKNGLIFLEKTGYTIVLRKDG